MEIIRTDKEFTYKKVKISELSPGDCFESKGDLMFVRVNQCYGQHVWLINLRTNVEWSGSGPDANTVFSDAILCDVKIIYERVLE